MDSRQTKSQFPHYSGPQVDMTHTDQTHPSGAHGYSSATDDTQRPPDVLQTSGTWGQVPNATGTYGGAVWKDQPTAPHSYGEMASDRDIYPGRQGPPGTGAQGPMSGADYTGQSATAGYGTRGPMGATSEADQTQYSGAHEAQVPQRKASVTDKLKGSLEKIQGKLTGDQAKVVEGDNLMHGRRL